MACARKLLLSGLVFLCLGHISAKASVAPNEVQTCTLEQEDELFAEYLSDNYKDRSIGLYKDLTTAVKEYRENKLQIVDVRNSAEHQKFRIPKSLNIPLGLLKHKSFLKKKDLLLVNNGARYQQLEKTVKELRESGFKNVHILNGGIERWADKTDYVDGKYTKDMLKTLSVKDFIAEAGFGPWLVIDTSENEVFEEEVNGYIKRIKLDDGFLLNFTSIVDEYSTPLTRILFVSDDRTFTKKLSSYLENTDYQNISILDKTIDAIPAYRKESLIAFQKRNKPEFVECFVE